MIELIGDNLIPLTAIVLAFSFFALWIVAATIDSIYKTRCNTILKEKLIASGASADEIERVLAAGKPDVSPYADAEPNRTFPPRKHSAPAC